MKKRVADIIMDVLVENGIVDCFSVVGGGAMHMNNAFALRQDIKKYYCHHEQACAMAAEAYAKYSGKMAVISVTSGPGALNTLNGVEGAWADSIPMLILAGHPRYETTVPPTGLKLRCRGVQEYDIIPTVKGMTKYAAMVLNPREIKKEVQKAIDIALEGRRGPTWLSIPLDVQSALIEMSELEDVEKIAACQYDDTDETAEKINCVLAESKRPCILAGSGIRASGTEKQFKQFVERMQIPVVGGALQADVMAETEPHYYGMSGNVGPRCGNYILQQADVIIVLGNSMSTKQTGFNQALFAPEAKIIMVDAEKDEPYKQGLKIEYPVFMELYSFFEEVVGKIVPWQKNENWIAKCDKIYETLNGYDIPTNLDEKERIPQAYFWSVFRKKISQDAILALGNSSGIVGMLQQGTVSKEQRVIVNYNSGSMGDDLPEAFGIAIASNKSVICCTGDGSIMMNLQELQTIRGYNLPIKIVLFANDGYGAIRQTNSLYFKGLYAGCDANTGVTFPDFEKVAEAFDFECIHCYKVEELEDCIDLFLKDENRKILIIEQKINDPTEPKVVSVMNEEGIFITPGLDRMTPLLDEELESICKG